MDKARILDLVCSAADQLNKQLRRSERLEKSPATVITGEGARLDSLGLVNLLVIIEEKVEQEFRVGVTLLEAMAEDMSHLHTLGTLSDYLYTVLQNKAALPNATLTGERAPSHAS